MTILLHSNVLGNFSVENTADILQIVSLIIFNILYFITSRIETAEVDLKNVEKYQKSNEKEK